MLLEEAKVKTLIAMIGLFMVTSVMAEKPNPPPGYWLVKERAISFCLQTPQGDICTDLKVEDMIKMIEKRKYNSA